MRHSSPGRTSSPTAAFCPASSSSTEALQHLSGVHDPERVEGVLDGAHGLHRRGAALELEEAAPRGADAVLCGHGPAESDGGPVEVRVGATHALAGGGIAALEHEVGVQVAVADMAEHTARQLVLHGDALDLDDHIGDPAARRADVVHAHLPLAVEGLQGQYPNP